MKMEWKLVRKSPVFVTRPSIVSFARIDLLFSLFFYFYFRRFVLLSERYFDESVDIIHTFAHHGYNVNNITYKYICADLFKNIIYIIYTLII